MNQKIFNSMSKEKTEFVPLQEGKVSMYVCGVTVYDYCHLGHARASVVFDMIYRQLKFLAYDVTYVRNFTDIDDKIIKRSNELKMDWRELVEKYISAFHQDMKDLGNLSPSFEPRATDYIEKMQNMISRLIERDKAYSVPSGDVFFAVRKFTEYGKLSHKNLEDLESGARIEIDEEKKDPLDFALWKSAKPHEPKWESPWGAGRPGWHIECSAMSTDLLGPTIDIHGGGRDLIFPHHENELAQSEACTEKNFVNYWVHNGFVNLNSDKMSKSTGNFMSIQDCLKVYPSQVLRFFLLSSAYNSPLDFNDQNMANAESAVQRVYECKARAEEFWNKDCLDVKTDRELIIRELASFADKFKEAMLDNFNSALALGYLFDVIRVANSEFDLDQDEQVKVQIAQQLKAHFELTDQVLGLFGLDAQDFLNSWQKLKSSAVTMRESEIESLLQERSEAKAEKNWARADEIRNLLNERGIEIKDSKEGTSWKYK